MKKGNSMVDSSIQAIVARKSKPDPKMPENAFEAYHSSSVDVLITHKPLPTGPGMHAHRGYEFFIPMDALQQEVRLEIEGNPSIRPVHRNLIPCNPEQYHGSKKSLAIHRTVCIYVQKEYMQNTAYALSGSKHIFFTAKNNTFTSDLCQLLDLFVEEARNRQTGYKFMLESISTQIVINLLRNTESNIQKKMLKKELSARNNIAKVIDYIHHNDYKEIKNDELLKLANLSPYYFVRLFKKETGATPHQYLVNRRIEKAKQLLKLSSHSITEICFLCGFSNHSHFAKVFKRKTGTSPLKFRQQSHP